MWRVLLLSLLLAFPRASVSADPVADRMVRDWAEWIRTAQIDTATLAILRDGKIVAEAAIGTPPDTARPLASLSKAITAACLLALKDRLPATTRVGDLLGAGPLATATIADLLNHSAGVWPDATQNNWALALARRARTGAVAARALARPPDPERQGVFTYNNENYAILGAMIEAATGKPYAVACRAAGAVPEGASATGPWAAHGPWGGWDSGAAAYARFLWQLTAQAAALDPLFTSVNARTRHGMGLLWRDSDTGPSAFAFGQLCWLGRGDGGFATTHPGGWSIVTLYDGCGPDRAGRASLRAILTPEGKPVR